MAKKVGRCIDSVPVSSDIYHPQCAPIHMSRSLRRHLVITFVKLWQLCVAYSITFQDTPKAQVPLRSLFRDNFWLRLSAIPVTSKIGIC